MTDPLEKYRIKESSQKVLDSPHELFLFLAEGKMLYELFGFTTEVMLDFYQAAISLLNDDRFEDAHDAFFFLASIAPRVSEFWRGLAFSCMQLSRFDEACENCQKAIESDPQGVESYLTAVRIFCSMQDYERAHSFINETISYAKKFEGVTWAEDLSRAMIESRDFVRHSFHDDQDSNFPS